MKKFFCIISLLLSSICIFSQSKQEKETKLKELFGTYKGCFVMYNLNKNSYYHYNDSMSNVQHSPMSTFKVANSLFALEKGIVGNEQSIMVWDSIIHPAQSWWSKLKWDRNQTLATAFENSVVWFYQEIAKEGSREDYKKFLNRISYGNKQIGERIDFFWLDGSLKISAIEQIEFLKSFYVNDFDFLQEHVNVVKRIFVRKQNERYCLSYKTGGGDIAVNKFIGWLIGYVEKDKNVYFFAMNILTDDFKEEQKLRMDISLNFLRYLDLID